MAKTYKKKTNKRRKTLRSKKYVGGVQRECPICCKDPKKICKFHIHKSQGAPPGSLINGPNYNTNAFYEDHIRTHPVCKYCPAPSAQEPSAQESLINRHYDTKALAEHLKEMHNDKYNVAQKIKTDLLDKNKTLITELNDNNIRQIGVLPELDMFYKQIAEKEMKMAEEKQKSQKPEKPTKTVAVKAEAAKAKVEALKAEKEAAEAEAKAKTAEEQRLKREEAEKRKAEEAAIQAAKAEEQEAIRKAAKIEADKAKKAAKKAAKAEAVETEFMGKEEELSKQLRAAQTVDEVVDIINNTLPQPPLEPLVPPQPELMPPLPPVKKINIKNIFKKRILDDKTDFYYKLKSFKFQQDIHGYILSLFPLLSCNTGTISNPSYYETVSLIIFITGILNRLFKVNIKLIIKGGKAAQMMLSAYGYSTCDINSDDIDILLIQENGHDREYLMDFAKQFAYLIQDRFIADNNKKISVLEPTEVNPNIYKISLFSNGYKPISDIDFKQDNSGFFTNESLMELPFIANYYGNQFELLYYLQNPKVFLEEKKHYLSIYENIIQKTHDGSKSCDCNVKNVDYECKRLCDYRTIMVEKFNKYIEPFEQLLTPKTLSATPAV